MCVCVYVRKCLHMYVCTCVWDVKHCPWEWHAMAGTSLRSGNGNASMHSNSLVIEASKKPAGISRSHPEWTYVYITLWYCYESYDSQLRVLNECVE